MNAPEGPSHKAPPAGDPLDRSRFPVDEWRLVETRFDGSDLGTTESLFTVGNGYLGLRGNYSESRDAHLDGTFINGFHETWPIRHAEEAFGFARVGQTIVNAPDAKIIRLYVDDEPLVITEAEIMAYERRLDFRLGVLSRRIEWRTPSGKRVLIIGAGNSGCDIAVDAVHHAASVDMSVRRGYYFVPRYLFGKPSDTLKLRPRLDQVHLFDAGTGKRL